MVTYANGLTATAAHDRAQVGVLVLARPDVDPGVRQDAGQIGVQLMTKGTL